MTADSPEFVLLVLLISVLVALFFKILQINWTKSYVKDKLLGLERDLQRETRRDYNEISKWSQEIAEQVDGSKDAIGHIIETLTEGDDHDEARLVALEETVAKLVPPPPGLPDPDLAADVKELGDLLSKGLRSYTVSCDGEEALLIFAESPRKAAEAYMRQSKNSDAVHDTFDVEVSQGGTPRRTFRMVAAEVKWEAQ